MLHIKSSKKRNAHRGMSSLIEVVISVVLFALLFIILMNLLNIQLTAEQNTLDSINREYSANNLIEMLQTDIKSSITLGSANEELNIAKRSGTVTYRWDDGVIYRNDEPIIDGVLTVYFVPIDDNAVALYMKFDDGNLLDITIAR